MCSESQSFIHPGHTKFCHIYTAITFGRRIQPKSDTVNTVSPSISHEVMGNRWEKSGNSVRLYFWGAPKSLQMVIAAMKLKDAYSLEDKL